MKKISSLILMMALSVGCAFATTSDIVWKNDLKDKFLNNEAIILEINIRSFNSKDIDGNGFINEKIGETKGNFINAIDRLDEIKSLGINTIHILPITQTGKFKAFGTAGSLYSIAKFDKISEDLYDKNSNLTLEEQAKLFITEAHKRDIRVIIDVPACASYDLYLERPDLFVKTTTEDAVIPADWNDVRLLDSGTEDSINPTVLTLYSDFVKYIMKLGADGIRVDVAHSKPANFWKLLIDYTHEKDSQFLWLAESSDSWHEAVSPSAVFTNYDALLNAGFDGYYGSFFNLKNWKTSNELNKQFTFTFNDLKKFKDKKAVIGSFTTHDEVSPILLKGEKLSEMMIWLNATLPVNSYFVDGFQTGDDYYYKDGNKLAEVSNTDDDMYFIHNGQIDIFNYSRKPGGKNTNLKDNFLLGNDVKKGLIPVLNSGNYTPLKTNNTSVFAYSFSTSNRKVITIGNLDFTEPVKAVVKVSGLNKKQQILPLKILTMPKVHKNKLSLNLDAGEIVVLVIK